MGERVGHSGLGVGGQGRYCFGAGADVGAGENGAAGGEPGDFVFLSRGYGAGGEKAIAALRLGLPMSV